MWMNDIHVNICFCALWKILHIKGAHMSHSAAIGQTISKLYVPQRICVTFCTHSTVHDRTKVAIAYTSKHFGWTQRLGPIKDVMVLIYGLFQSQAIYNLNQCWKTSVTYSDIRVILQELLRISNKLFEYNHHIYQGLIMLMVFTL